VSCYGLEFCVWFWRRLSMQAAGFSVRMTDRAGLKLQKAELSDLHAIAGLFRLTRRICLPFLPQLHTLQEDIEFFREKIFPRHDLAIALMGGTIAGYSAVSPGWLEQLYVLPQCQGSGVGALLLARAKEGQAAFQLYVFQKNLRARRFYEKHGLRLVLLTDGAENEEREPDALYEWKAGAPHGG
jgi:putative acetyltransferase